MKERVGIPGSGLRRSPKGEGPEIFFRLALKCIFYCDYSLSMDKDQMTPGDTVLNCTSDWYTFIDMATCCSSEIKKFLMAFLWFSLLVLVGLSLAKSAQLSWKFDLEAIRKHTKLYQIDCSTYRAFCIYLIVWTALFDKRSLPWRSVAEASLVNHERFPGRDVLKGALLNGQTWFARSGTKVAELGSPAGLKNKTQKKIMPWLIVRTLLQL